MSAYPVVAVCAVSAAFLLFITAALRNKGDRNKGDGSFCSARTAAAAALSFPLCTALGFVSAKFFYVLLMETGHIVEWGEWDALFSLRPDTFCFTGGGVGVWLGLLLSARITGCRPAGTFLDLFTVPGLLLAAGLRMAEMELGSLGTGRFIEAAAVPPFPFAVVNEYGEAHVAVFFWEALWALAVLVLSLFGRNRRPGARFEAAVFRLCAGQIVLEAMRTQALSWGFVRVEQVLCAAIMMILTLCACARNTKKQGAARFLPALFLLACFAAIVGIEFLRQRSPSRFMGETGGFLLMALVLLPSIRYAGDGSFCTKNSRTER